jgi:hypothetical protein
MPSNVMHIDTQRAMAVAPADEPRTLDEFKRAVSDSMSGTAKRMQMSATAASKAKPQKSIWSTFAENKLLIALAFVGIALATWQLLRRR